jgi:hypothetical protein
MLHARPAHMHWSLIDVRHQHTTTAIRNSAAQRGNDGEKLDPARGGMVLRNWPPKGGMVLRNSAQGGMLVKTDNRLLPG